MGRIRTIFISVAVAIVAVVMLVIWQSRPTKVVAKKQAELISGIEGRNAARIRRLMSDAYIDQWEFDANDASEALVDVGSQFLTLVLKTEEQVLSIEDGRAEVSVRLTLGGNAIGPVGGEVTRRINRMKEPFTFVWQKESFLPSSWRLVKIDQIELPENLYGYEPGDIRRAMSGGE